MDPAFVSPKRIESGLLNGSSGSVPANISCPSKISSPSVSGLNGSVLYISSSELVRPSLSSSPSGSNMWKVLAVEPIVLELPEPLPAINVKEPVELGSMVNGIVANVPDGLIVGKPNVIAGGTNSGINANVASLRLFPVTSRLGST